jgi:hypothetical protein
MRKTTWLLAAWVLLLGGTISTTRAQSWIGGRPSFPGFPVPGTQPPPGVGAFNRPSVPGIDVNPFGRPASPLGPRLDPFGSLQALGLHHDPWSRIGGPSWFGRTGPGEPHTAPFGRSPLDDRGFGPDGPGTSPPPQVQFQVNPESLHPVYREMAVPPVKFDVLSPKPAPERGWSWVHALPPLLIGIVGGVLKGVCGRGKDDARSV